MDYKNHIKFCLRYPHLVTSFINLETKEYFNPNFLDGYTIEDIRKYISETLMPVIEISEETTRNQVLAIIKMERAIGIPVDDLLEEWRKAVYGEDEKNEKYAY